MCGFLVFGHKLLPKGEREEQTKTLRDTIFHRGPDDGGLWSPENFPLSLAHRRLSILDLSPLGHQPMASASKRMHIVFNGEIYNFHEIRQELELLGHSFRSSCDTEVLVTACEAFGVEATLTRVNGMYAFALWDEQEQTLTLARDRLGKKPLLYAWHNHGFVAGSELRLMLEIPGQSWKLDRSACADFLRSAYFPAPITPLRGIYKLLPGTTLTLRAEDLLSKPTSFSPLDADYSAGTEATCRPRRFWNLLNVRSAGVKKHEQSEQLWIEEGKGLLKAAVARRMIADVPLGAFLSGGIDSSLVCALMQEQSSKAIETFTVRFDEAEHDEGEYAAKVSKHLGTSHHELYVHYSDALELVPALPKLYDEPLGDASQIPTLLVSRFARKHVTVALSGDAGDELFWGYQRYALAAQIGKVFFKTPGLLRRIVGASLEIPSRELWEKIFQLLYTVLPQHLQIRQPSSKIGRFSELLKSRGSGDLYCQMMTHWQDAASIFQTQGRTPHSFDHQELLQKTSKNAMELGSLIDILTYLPGDIFYKVDQASMSCALEARSPFCDNTVVDFALQCPASLKFQNGKGKWFFRKLLDEYFPAELFNRRKQGFMIPLAEWLRGPLRDWGESLLSKAEAEDFLNLEIVRRRWEEHKSGHTNWEYHLWDIFQLLAWLEEWRGVIDISSSRAQE